MKTDVLNDFDILKVGVGYGIENSFSEKVPYDITHHEQEVVYREFPGWNTSLGHLGAKDDMPSALKDYISYIQKNTGVPVIGLSYGPDREETLFF
jgi:adenylosuccinate synthase